mmetsp:Transcript_60068/g.143087  ORF Transcript_60068/g.143087 Transcript_60068/m.143087 type:complete len:538 (-) Transcript_60068:78-1691(-)
MCWTEVCVAARKPHPLVNRWIVWLAVICFSQHNLEVSAHAATSHSASGHSGRSYARRSATVIAVDADGSVHQVDKEMVHGTSSGNASDVPPVSKEAVAEVEEMFAESIGGEREAEQTKEPQAVRSARDSKSKERRGSKAPELQPFDPFGDPPVADESKQTSKSQPMSRGSSQMEGSRDTSREMAAFRRDSVRDRGGSSRHYSDNLWEKVGSAEAAAPPDGELEPAPETSFKEPQEPSLMKAVEGIGASAFARSPVGSRTLDRELRTRLEVQDLSALLFLAAGLAMTVLVTCFSVYKSAEDESPALFYTDPSRGQVRLLCESVEVPDFLEAFNAAPRGASLRIIGWMDEPQGRSGCFCDCLCRWLRWLVYSCVGWPSRSLGHDTAEFDVVLDLAPFVAGEGDLKPEDANLLERLLHSGNPLLEIVLQKKVQWKMWEDVATNIRQRLRTLGFRGHIEILLETQDEVVIYRNHHWSNFVRNPVTHALAVLSVVGIFLWKPYVWMRTQRVKVPTYFSINIEPARYWELLVAGLDRRYGFIG